MPDFIHFPVCVGCLGIANAMKVLIISLLYWITLSQISKEFDLAT